jgi:PAS domain S-box-containing protein
MGDHLQTQGPEALEAREMVHASQGGALEQRPLAQADAQSRALLFEGLIESAMDAIISVDEEQRIVLFNRAAQTMFRCPKGDAIGQPLDQFIPPRFRETHRAHLEAFGRSGLTNRRMGALGSVVGLRADGEEFPAEASISQITIGQRKYFTVILRDLTERQRIENQLRASEERFRRITELSPDAIFISRNERTVFVNRRGLKLLGATSPDQILGRPPLDFVHPDSRAAVGLALHRLSTGADSVPVIQERFTRLDGSPVEVELTAASFMDTDGLVIQMVVRDITQQRRVEQQLRQTEQLAELGTLAAGVAHEIGTPMNVILGRAEQLLRKASDEATRKALGTIVAQVERVTKIMNQLLTFARYHPAERRAVNLSQTLDDCLEVLEERLRRARVKVEQSGEITCGPVYVEADPDQMSQLFLNLFMNALQAMPEGGVLRIAAEPINGLVKIVVADTGCGIPPEHLPKIFLPFFTTKTAGQGTGLGLTVVHKIVQEHGGTISVTSEPGKGTTFTITLPAPRGEARSTRGGEATVNWEGTVPAP